MKRILTLMFCMALSYQSVASAEILVAESKIEKNFGNTSVDIIQTGTLKISEASHPVTNVGAALRIKNKVFMDWDVYVGQLLVTNPTSFVRNDADQSALRSLDKMQAVAMRMVFTLSVSAGDLMSGFNDQFKNNKIDPKTVPAVSEFLKIVKASRGAHKDETVTVAAERLNDSRVRVTYQASDGKVASVIGPSEFLYQVFSLWLGNTKGDDHLTHFKNNIINGTD